MSLGVLALTSTSAAAQDFLVNLVTPASTPVLESSLSITGNAGYGAGHYLAFADDGRIFVPDGIDIVVLDGASLAVIARIMGAASDGGVNDLAFDAGRQRLYVCDNSSVHVFDSSSFLLVDTISILPSWWGNRLAEDPVTARLYVANPESGSYLTVDLTKAMTDTTRISVVPLDTPFFMRHLAVDAASHLVYLAGDHDDLTEQVKIVDGDPTNTATFLSVLKTVMVPFTFTGTTPIAVDRGSHRVYVSVGEGIEVIDGNRGSATFGNIVDTITNLDMGIDVGDDSSWWSPFDIDPDRGRAYVWVTNTWCGWPGLFITVDVSTKALLSRVILPDTAACDTSFVGEVQLSPSDHRVFILNPNPPTSPDGLILQDTNTTAASTRAGTSMSASFPGVSLTFAAVTGAGTTTATTVDPRSLNLTLPGAFALLGTGFDLKTSATFTAPITVCFDAASVTDPIEFARLQVLHGENGSWVDRTSSRDFTSGLVCGTVGSLSPFAIARQIKPAHSVVPVFDQTKANKLGSTVPIKIQVDNLNGTNASSAALAVSVLALTRISTQAPGPLVDAGNANPDATFRFDASLAGYIYNLQTKPLASGTWDLTLAIGLDSTTYHVPFQIK